VDGDGDLDILSACRWSNEIAWQENDGGSPPGFTEHVITISANGAVSVHAADVDGDGDIDVLSASADDDTIAWYENDGGSTPSFTARAITTSADDAKSVYAADVDGDGDLDVLSASTYDDEIVWHKNDGGSPPGFTEHVISTSVNGAYSVHAADVDGDGDLDVLSASTYDDTIAWYENDGGSSPGFSKHAITTSANGARSVYTGDVDSDGDLDILSASYADGTIAWYENDGGSVPGFTERAITTSADGAHSVYAGDMDGDGDLDVLSASSIHDTIAWYPNQTIHRSAVYPARAVITDAADGAKSVHVADVDGDGDLDALSASAFDDAIAWYENEGGLPPAFKYHFIATVRDAYAVHAADVNGDGDMDVLAASRWDDRITWYENDGRSSPSFTAHTVTNAADGAISVYTGDVDGDGDLDILSASSYDDTVAWYESDGGSSPTFSTHDISTAADDAKFVHAGDLDGDGDLDVLSASREDDKIAWYENDGGSHPGFTAHVITTAADGAYWVQAADVDGDGDLDVLSASAYDDKIAWYKNDGRSPPTFIARSITTSAEGAQSVGAADLDSDGDVDVLSASLDDDTIAWYENDGGSSPGFSEHVITTSADGAREVRAADVDGDGDLDVLSASTYDDTIAWYENRGGQFALATVDTAPATIDIGQMDDVLRIVAAHRGRSGDTDAELSTFELLFEERAGDPLTTAEANSLIENLHVYQDDGSGAFEPGTDTLVATVGTLSLAGGAQTIPFADGDPKVRLTWGAPLATFVVVELTHDASSQTPHQFRVTHVTDLRSWAGLDATSTAEDRDHDIPLCLEYAPNVSTGTVEAVGVLPPSAPTLYAISNPDGDGNYLVDWSNVSEAMGYTLQEDDNPTFSSPTTRYSGSDSQWTASGQAAGTWYYRVRASNAGGDSPWSGVQSVTVDPVEPPPAPTLYAIDNADGDGDYVVDWSHEGSATGYTLQEDDNAAFSSPTTRYSGSDSQWTTSDHAAGTWYYRVRASNAVGDSPWSNAESATVTPPTLPTPTLYVIDNADRDGDYMVDWSDVSGATRYLLQEDDSPAFDSPTVRYNSSNSEWAASGQASGTWYYRVRASNGGGYSPWSDVQSVTVGDWVVSLPLMVQNYLPLFEGPWEMEDNDSSQEANGPLRSGVDYYGYPDDSRDYFSVYLRTDGDIAIDLTDHTGQGVQLLLYYESIEDLRDRVWKEPYHIDYSGPSGWYYILIYTESGHNSDTPYSLRVSYP
jgi:hypothetical protein